MDYTLKDDIENSFEYNLGSCFCNPKKNERVQMLRIFAEAGIFERQ